MKKLPIQIKTINFFDDQTDDCRVIDWSNSSDRKWLTSHQTWAFHNDKYIIMAPARS